MLFPSLTGPSHRSSSLAAADMPASAGRDTSPWLRFTWACDKVPAIPVPSTVAGDLIRPASREEAEQVVKVILLSFSMDSTWNDSLSKVEEYITASVARLFNEEDPLCLVIPKGNRIIAASLLDQESGAVSNLVSGPSVLMEYRNRGIGSRLLHASLAALRDRGLVSATGITRTRTTAALHVYPKFGGKGEAVQFSAPAESRPKVGESKS